MKKLNFTSALALAVLALGSVAFTVHTTTYKVDTFNSNIQWKGYKVTGEHSGVVNLKNGTLDFNDAGQLTGGAFEIDMNTIKVTDISGEYATKLEGHLKNDDFFGVSTYPTAKFVTTRVVPKGKPGEFKVTGKLTIKETTKEVKFDTYLTTEGNKVTALADIKLDRTDYNVQYGSGSFFDGLGDKTIYDEFDLKVKLVAKK